MENPSRYLPHITWIHFIEGTFYDSLYAICLRMIVNKDSLLTADVFPVVASLSPEGERNDRKYICGSQAKTKTTKF